MKKITDKEFEILNDIMSAYNLSSESVLFRYSLPKHISTTDQSITTINAKDNPEEIIIEGYQGGGHSIHASNIGPGLAFTLVAEEDYKTPHKVCIEVKIKDIIEQGGLIYKVTSVPAHINAFFFTLPQGKVKVKVV